MEEDFLQEEKRARREMEHEKERAREDHIVSYATSRFIDTVSSNTT